MPYNISRVEVQGAKDAMEWPYKFCLSYSLNGSQFTELAAQETSCSVSHRGTSKFRWQGASSSRVFQYVRLVRRRGKHLIKKMNSQLEPCTSEM